MLKNTAYKQMKKRLVTAGLAVSMLLSMATFTYAQEKVNLNAVRLVVAGEELTNLPMAAIIYNDYTLVPAREVFEKMGAVVDWKPANKEIYVAYGDKLMVMTIDKIIANVDGVDMPMAIAPKIINDKTMIPLRFVSESLGFEVGWDKDTRIASVGASEVAPPTLDLAALEQLNIPSAPLPEPTQTPLPQVIPLPQVTPAPQTGGGLSTDRSTAPITAIVAPETKIISVTNANNSAFAINASTAISKVEKSVLPDNRLVIDVFNAEMALTQSEYTIGGGSVQKIRVAQNQSEPTKVTRVVFDLVAGSSFKVGLSEDRKTIQVDFEQSTVTGVSFQANGAGDTLTLNFSTTPSVKVYPLTNPDQLVVEVPNAQLVQGLNQVQNGKFVSNVTTTQFDPQTVRIVMDLKGIAMYASTTEANTVTIKLTEPTFKNIKYNTTTKTIEIKKTATAMQLNNWVINDQYNSLKYTLVLPGDYSGLLGYGAYVLNDNDINAILIQNNASGQTEITINETRVLAYNVTEDNQNVYIKAVHPKEKYARIVVLDAGHGGTDVGTSGHGLLEKDVNFDVTNRAAALLEKEGSVKVYLTRTTDYKVPLEDRPVFANAIGDLFVSIHCNSGDKNTAANGIETYYYAHDNDATIGISTKTVANIIQKNMLLALGSADRKVKTNAFVVIKNTKIPSALIELGFLSNAEEATRMATDHYRQQSAEGIYKSVLEIFQQYVPRHL